MYSAKVPAFSLAKSPAGPHSLRPDSLFYTLTFFLGVGVCVSMVRSKHCCCCPVGTNMRLIALSLSLSL